MQMSFDARVFVQHVVLHAAKDNTLLCTACFVVYIVT